MKTITVLCLMGILLLASCSFLNTSNSWTVKSPNGKIAMTIELAQNESGEAELASRGELKYSVTSGLNTVIESSSLGLQCGSESFSRDLVFLATSKNKIENTYTLHNSKRSELTNEANELTLTFVNAKDVKFQVIARAYDDGVAFKYAFPEGEGQKIITAEATTFKIPPGTATLLPFDDPGQYVPAYENYWGAYNVGDAAPMNAGWALPALFKINDGQNYVLLAESGLNGSYCGTRLEQDAPNGLYKVRFPEEADGEGVGKVSPTAVLPWSSSWKVAIIGDSANDIAESSLVTHVAYEPVFEVADYIKPGRAAWSWWSDSDSPRNFARQKDFIDLAENMGWEYYLLDANWNFEPREDLLDFVNYANDKGVGVLVWYNSGGPHNIVTEAPRDIMVNKERRRQEFQWLKEIGVKGVKVDFWHSDKQDMIQYYIDLMKDANDFEILVNFHGCTVPRGWERTYPNMLTLESARGAETYKFGPEFPVKAPAHNVNLVYTRNVIGPMDYTPVGFTDMDYPHLTTYGHELALAVLYQSGIQHFCDKPEGYYAQPDEVQQFLKDIPVVWDDIKALEGEPGEYAVLARRSGDTWFIGGISALNEPKTVTIDLSQFGETDALLIGDKEERVFDIRAISGTQDITMLPLGGFVIKM